MAVETPAWLNEEFIEKTLKNSEKDESIKVKGITTKPATAKGDNYTSEMIRVLVEYSRSNTGRGRTEKKSLVVKIAPYVDGAHKDMISEVGLFDTEIKMMETTLKKMNDMVNEGNYRLSASVLFTKIGDPSLLVIEDLAPLGFRMADRLAGLDLQHCLLAVRGLGKFHASSVAICEKEPDHKLAYKKGMFNMDHPADMRRFFTQGLKCLGNEVANWTEFGPDASVYAEKLNKISDSCYSRAADCMTRNDAEFNVINHGDFWVNNMLFRYNNEGKVLDHIFVDFQLCLYASPAIDLLYFLHTSPSDEVDLNHRETLLEEYLNTLRGTMSRLGCKTKPPTMEELKKHLMEREFYGILSAFTILPVVLVDKSEAKSLDEIMKEDGSYDNPGYKSELYRKVMVRKLPQWNARGFLDL